MRNWPGAMRVGCLVVLILFFAAPVSLTAQNDRSELDGVWILGASADVEGLELTPQGQAAFDAYDYFTDEPNLQCIPASITRIMHTPSPPIEIRQHDNLVEINYEFMDVRRRVPLDPALSVEEAPYAVTEFPHLGRSIGRYEGETLIVETAIQHAGILDSLGVPGLPQSNQMRTEERFIPDGDRMTVVVTHNDPVNYAAPLVVTFPYLRIDSEILEWGCTPEEASYDQFELSPQ